MKARMSSESLAAPGDSTFPLPVSEPLPWPPLLSREWPVVDGVTAPPQSWRWTNASSPSGPRPLPLVVSGRGFGAGAFEPDVAISIAGVECQESVRLNDSVAYCAAPAGVGEGRLVSVLAGD